MQDNLKLSMPVFAEFILRKETKWTTGNLTTCWSV